MRRSCAVVRPAPLQLVRRSPKPSTISPTPCRAFYASPIRRLQAATGSAKPVDAPAPAPKPSGSPDDSKPAVPSNVILRHSIPSYRFIHSTIIGQLAVAWVVSPVILADEQFILNPVAPWLAFGLPVWATGQWLLWRWFVRHWIMEVRALPGPTYEVDTLSRSFARVQTRSLLPADLFSRERVTAHTSILRLKDKQYYLLSTQCCDYILLTLKYQTGAQKSCSPTTMMLSRSSSTLFLTNLRLRLPLRHLLWRQKSAKNVRAAPSIISLLEQIVEAQRLELASQYRPFKREPKPEGSDSETSPKSPPT